MRSVYNFIVNFGGSSGGSVISVFNNVIVFFFGMEIDGSGEFRVFYGV